MRYLFIVGCPRSGTTWVSWLLAQHPETVVSLHSGFFQSLDRTLDQLYRPAQLGNLVVGRMEADGTASTSEGTSRVSDLLDRRDLNRATRGLVEALMGSMVAGDAGATWLVEKTPENLLHAELIRDALPEAHFLHVVRDPRAVFSSMRSAAKQWAYPGDLPTSPAAFVRGYWLPYLEAGRQLGADTDGYKEVRYEDLLSKGPESLGEIFDWMGVEADRTLCETAVEASSIDRMRARLTSAPKGFFRRGTADSWRGDLPKSHVAVIEYLAGERMEQFGYHCSARPSRAPLRLRLADGVAQMGKGMLEGPLGRILEGLFGRARRSAKTLKKMTNES